MGRFDFVMPWWLFGWCGLETATGLPQSFCLGCLSICEHPIGCMEDDTAVPGSLERLGTPRDARQAACSEMGRSFDRPRFFPTVSDGFCFSIALLRLAAGLPYVWSSFFLHSGPEPLPPSPSPRPHSCWVEVTAKARRGGPFCRARAEIFSFSSG